jgi:CysZ protein
MSTPPPPTWESVPRALRRAGRDLFTGPMLGLVFLPMCLALLVWGGSAWLFGETWHANLTELLAATPLRALAQWTGAEWLLPYSAIFFLILLWLPAVYVSALLITSLALMPIIIGQIGARQFPRLERRAGGSALGSVANGLYAMLVYVGAWVITLPLWLIGPFGFLMSLWLNTWLNQRLFLYDALAEHADHGELNALRHEGGGPVLALSAILSLLHLVPVVGLLAPVYMGLAFGHYALDRLDQARGGRP